MNIVDVNEFYSPTGGGVRSYVDRKMEILGSQGHQLTVIAPGETDAVEERSCGGRIVYVASPRLPFDRNYGLFWKAEPILDLLDGLAPDVVECSSPFRPAWIVGRWCGAALKVFFMHNDNLEAYPKRWFSAIASPSRIEQAFGWYSRYMNRFLTHYDTVLTNGPVLHQRLTARGVRVDASMALGIERGIFSPGLRCEDLRAAILTECGLPANATLLLGVGRHHREKRWEMVIDAVEMANRRTPVALCLIGTGPRRDAIERKVAGLPFVRLLDPIYDRTRLAALMASCDAYIHGSDSEPFGLVVSEALACGAPLIVPDEGGAGAVANSSYAETFAAGRADDCAAAIARLLNRNATALRQAAGNAATMVRSDRDHVEQLLGHYQRMASRCTWLRPASGPLRVRAQGALSPI